MLEYEPVKGFLVSWEGYPSSSNSWQRECDMPPSFMDCMNALKESPKVLHSILKFDPTNGFLVHWRGCPESMDSWIPHDEVGEGYRYQAQLARERYQDNSR